MYACIYILYILHFRDLRSFEIRFEFESNDSNSIRKWRADSKFAVVPQTALTVQQKNFNRCTVVIEIYLMFMILCLCSKSIYIYIYTLASTVWAIVQYCLRNQENLHISFRL